MGLDIRVQVTPEKVLSAKHLTEAQRKLLPLFRDACSEVHTHLQDSEIFTEPGFYHGVTDVRIAWIQAKGFQAAREMPESMYDNSHLLNHSDCDGWYLPDDFATPIWKDELSIGSSPRLVKELLEIDPATLNKGVRYSWFAMLAPALGSFLGNEPMCFL